MSNSTKKWVRVYADKVDSNIEEFKYSWGYISKGGKKSPTYLFLKQALFFDGSNQTKRNFQKSERRESGMALARLAIQVFEQNIDNLSNDERKRIKTDGTGSAIGFWTDKDELIKAWGNSENAGKKSSSEYVNDQCLGNGYPSNSNAKYYFYNYGMYDSIEMAKSLLQMFGTECQYFEIEVTQNDEQEIENPIVSVAQTESAGIVYQNRFSVKVLDSKNVIFHGAPGTGKTYLAREIAADIISGGRADKIDNLTPEEKAQFAFVQFHPSYDYTDFVEGLRPITTADGQVCFELRDGTFKSFVDTAIKSTQTGGQDNFREAWNALVNDIVEGKNRIPRSDVEVSINSSMNIKFNSPVATFEQTYEIYKGNHRLKYETYNNIVIAYLKEAYGLKEYIPANDTKTDKKYVFIIDEVNRGEISKIFGELFFSLDPGYRGKAGEVSTQYSNLHENPNEKFYIPSNVYIIATMNDIDRSVDSFDFAMRRRFRFIEIKADDMKEMLDLLNENADEAEQRMNSLNAAISEIPELNANYHVGASYFLKLREVSFEQLWTDYLSPLLQDYIRGMYDEVSILKKFKKAYEMEEIDNERVEN